jgi:CheY-like chemotaxis protein
MASRKKSVTARDDEKDSRPLVLVVDDYDDAREMFCEYLELAGFRVVSAKDGREALDRASELVPDVVVMDLSLPVVDGAEATRRLKKGELTKTIPVIVLSGHQEESVATGLACDAYLRKPCLPDVLVSEVQKQVRARRP